MSRSREIRDFAQDAYDYIWSQQIFSTKGVKEKFVEGYSLRCSLKKEMKVTNFTEGVGKAVQITQFLLRDYFHHLFLFTIPNEELFKNDVKLMWTHWLDNRTNIFVKVIDTLAIIAESFMFTDYSKNLKYELNEMTEWFIEWFDEHLASEFFKYGGWKKLNNLAFEWYNDMFKDIKDKFVNLFYNPNHSKFVDKIYSCDLVDCLRYSPVKFPVPESALCGNCKLPTDKNLHRRIVYVRLCGELDVLLSKFNRKCLPVKQRKVKFDMKENQISSKLEHKEELTTEIIPQIMQKLQNDEIEEDYIVGNTKDVSIVQCLSEFPTISKVSTKVECGIQVDRETCTGNISTVDLRDNNLELLGFHSIGALSKNGNLKSKQNTGILSETFEPLKLETLTEENYSKQQLTLTERSDTKEVNESKDTLDIEVNSLISVNTKLNLTQELTPKQAEHVSECIEQSIKSDAGSENAAVILSLPESSANLKQTPVTEQLLKSKEVFKTCQSVEETKSNEISNPPLPAKVYSYEQFMDIFLHKTIEKYYPIEGSEDQNAYLISDLFSNSFEKLFEAYRTNTITEKLNTLNTTECLISTVPEDISKQQSNIPFDLSRLQFDFREYRFYFLGGEKIFETTKKSKRRRGKK